MQEYQISVILDKESFDILEKEAKANDRSQSAQLRIILKERKK